MTFLSMLKSLLGEGRESSGEQQGFQLQPDSDGLNFFLEKNTFNRVCSGNGSTYQKLQLIALRMLEEQGLAKPLPNGYRIEGSDIAGLDDEQAEVLDLPPRFSGSFVTDIRGRTGQSGFEVRLKLQMPDGGVVPVKRKGPFLQVTSTERYRLTPAELMGLEALDHHCQLLPEQRNESTNLRLIAELQTAARSGMNIDLSHFERLDVIVPEGIGVVATRLPNGNLVLSPSLGEGSTPDQLQKRWSQLDLNDKQGIMRIENRVVLLNEERIAGIREVFNNRHIPIDQIPAFLATPTAFLDAALVDLEMGFSIRVSGIGVLHHIDFGAAEGGGQDWFGLDTSVEAVESLKEIIRSPEDLERFKAIFEKAVSEGASTLIFKGRTLDISNLANIRAEIEQLTEQFELTSPPKCPSDVDKTQVGLLLHEASEIRRELRRKAEEAKPTKDPNWGLYSRTPFPHQQEGINWMCGLVESASKDTSEDLYRLQGGLLADDMGLGKTYMTLVTLGEYLQHQASIQKTQKPILVVAPLSLLENWEEEVEKTFNAIPFRDVVVLQAGRDLNAYRIQHAERESVQLARLLDENDVISENSIRYALHTGPEAGAKRLDMDRRLVLTTYQTLRDYQFSLCHVDWGIVVFDEAQNIKNPNTLQSRAAKALKADFKLLATGTPVENSLGDFWCLMDTAQPGILGNWEVFRETWISPIQSASDEDRDVTRRDIGRNLREAVGSFMLRRVKEDQLQGLPNKMTHTGVPQTPLGNLQYEKYLAQLMQGDQLQAYDQVLSQYHSQSNTHNKQGQALAALLQLREISLHPRLRQETQLQVHNPKQAKTLMQESGKLDILLKLLSQIKDQQEKVILFMITKRLQRLLKLWLDQIFDLDIAIINGDTAAVTKKSDVMTRKKLINAFEAKSGFNVIIMSPVAAGVGLTVVGANHVVHLERHWNPAKEAQASDRVYRIGQKKDVHIYLPAVTHPKLTSFDVHLDKLVNSKIRLKDAIVTSHQVTESEIVKTLGL